MSKRIIRLSSMLLSILILSLFVLSISNISADIYSSISGRVIAEDTDGGLSGVSVLALKIGEKRGHYFATTDERGVYVLKDLTAGAYMIRFFGGDSPYFFGGPPIKVILPKGKNVVNVNHILKLGGSVSGIVYGSDGVTPLSGVSVSADVPNQPEWVDGFKTGLTDNNGKFFFQGLPESDNCVVKVDVRGRASLTKTVKITKGKITENVNFVVKWDDITGISGYVKSSIDNKPVKDAEVVLRDTSGNDIGNAYTDATGKYSIVGIPPGTYKATAFMPKTGNYLKKINILIETGKSTEVNFEFDEPAP